uniref:MARVEL domain-containing protein n=1 Tax=Caenorhabditis tropicalis TaxID=1561998 RepID=A0A1I7USJ5_9PELO
MRGVSAEYFDDFYPDFHMAATANRVPFDQNDRKYKCLCGQLHIKKGARIVAILVNILTAINIIFSFTRSSTVFVYTCMSAAFSIVIFGSLLYGVWKEKRLYLYPYLFFQIISIVISIIILFTFLISIAVGASMVVDLARNVGNVDISNEQEKLDADLAAFTVLFILFLCIGGLIQAYFVDVIYSFHNFLKDRENSFSFNFESYSNNAFASETTPTPPPTYPETQVSMS